MTQPVHEAFIAFAMAKRALLFGEYRTKAGRMSPYFLNAGLFNDGNSLDRLSAFYAQAIAESEIRFDGMFGPAYKGIPLVCVAAVGLSRLGRNYPWTFNRKEAKDHGEGGNTVGAPLEGDILLVDDVISAGTAVRKSVEIIQDAGARLSGIAISFDRQERGSGPLSGIQEIEEEFGVRVISIARLDDLVGFLEGPQSQSVADVEKHLANIRAYREKYGPAIG